MNDDELAERLHAQRLASDWIAAGERADIANTRDPWVAVANNADGVCDLCGATRVVGWTRVPSFDRNRLGIRDQAVFLVCAEHIVFGEPVHPRPDTMWTAT